jgi:hypothetical protein
MNVAAINHGTGVPLGSTVRFDNHLKGASTGAKDAITSTIRFVARRPFTGAASLDSGSAQAPRVPEVSALMYAGPAAGKAPANEVRFVADAQMRRVRCHLAGDS